MDRLRGRHRRCERPAGGGRLKPVLAAAALLLLTVLLGWAAQRGLTTPFDEAGLRALSGAGAPAAWRAVSRLGDSHVRLAIAAAVVITLLVLRHRRAALQFAVIVLGGLALNGVAKQIASRPRPGLLQHLEAVDGFSFPSGHSAGMAALALGLACLAPPGRRAAALLLATGLLLLVGLSRIALAVHWPSDVLAGWMEGTGWVLLVRGATRGRDGRG